MSRYRLYGTRDDQAVQDGDHGFIGTDMRRLPTVLQPGLCSYARNKDFSSGSADTRKGIHTVGWGAVRATSWPLRFRPDHEFFELFEANPACFANLNFRIYAGTTFQLLSPAPVRYHTIYLSNANGPVVVMVDPVGMIASNWVFAEYNLADANFRFLGKTFQLRCVETQLWHTVWFQIMGGAPVLMVDQVGMATGDPFVDADTYNYLVRGDTTFQLLETTLKRWHSLWIEYNGGIPTLAWPELGLPSEGLSFNIQRGFGDVQGADIFSDPYGNEAALIARKNIGIYRVADGRVPEVIYLPEVGANRLDCVCVLDKANDLKLLCRGDKGNRRGIVREFVYRWLRQGHVPLPDVVASAIVP